MSAKNEIQIEKKSSFKGVNRVRVSDIVIVIIITALSLTCVLPFIHIFAKSISSSTAVLSKAVFLWPKDVTFKAYGSVFRDGQLTHAMLYTVKVTVLFTLIGMIITVCAAWPLSRKRLKGRTAFSLIIMFTMYFSAGLIPEYLLMKSLNLINNQWVLILPLCFAPYNMLIMKSFFQSTIPDSLEEAAFLDGASNFKIITRIVLPLSKPILATISLFYAVGRWNAYADAKYFITKRALQPVQLILANMVLANGDVSLSDPVAATMTPEVLQSAAIMFVTIPILLIYPFLQKYFVQGVMIGAVKG